MTSAVKNEKAVFMPFVDIYENEKAFEVFAELPGLDQRLLGEHLKVTLEDGVLNIEANIEDLAEGNKKAVTEFLRGKFKRSFKVSEKLDKEHFSGSYKDGVLHLTLPKLTKESARQIVIRSA